jgi:hypothetical protein
LEAGALYIFPKSPFLTVTAASRRSKPAKLHFSTEACRQHAVQETASLRAENAWTISDRAGQLAECSNAKTVHVIAMNGFAGYKTAAAQVMS